MFQGNVAFLFAPKGRYVRFFGGLNKVSSDHMGQIILQGIQNPLAKGIIDRFMMLNKASLTRISWSRKRVENLLRDPIKSMNNTPSNFSPPCILISQPTRLLLELSNNSSHVAKKLKEQEP